MSTIERAGGYYEVQEVEFGRVYKWRSESVAVECDCGERFTLTGPVAVCQWCGAEHAVTFREELDDRSRSRDEALHPWRYARDPEDGGIPF